MADIDPATAEKTARQLLDTRVETVHALAARRAALREAREAVTAAESAGWAEPDLRHVGFTPPGTRAPGQPRRQNRKASNGNTA